MKYLQEYREEAQTNLFKKYGVFFAFSNEQFAKGRNELKQSNLLLEGEKITAFGAGMYAPSKHVKIILSSLDTINTDAMQLDLKENGKSKIIVRELYNYECFYTHDFTDAFASLKPYGFTSEDIRKEFIKEIPSYELHNN